MNYIHGRSCALAVRFGNDVYPLPYREETIHSSETGYYLDSCIGGKKDSVFIRTGYAVSGCVITRLEKETLVPLFRIIDNTEATFDILTDRVIERKQYTALKISSFELRAENGGAFYLKLEVCSTYRSAVSDWDINTPDIRWNENDTLLFDGHAPSFDDHAVPFVYLFSLQGDFRHDRCLTLAVHTPLSAGNALDDPGTGIFTIPAGGSAVISFHGLTPTTDLADINCGDTVLVTKRFRIGGGITVLRSTADSPEKVVL